MATTSTPVLTFAEFEQLPSPKDGKLELRHGEVFKAPPPQYDHFMIQQMLKDLLDQAAAGRGRAYTEAAFRAKPEGEYRVADVAYCSNDRWRRRYPDGYFEGAPDLVIEVLSPSNTIAEMLDKKILCLENGSREFWMVDAEHRQVEVATPDGRSITYKLGQEIPLLFGGSLRVDAVFS